MFAAKKGEVVGPVKTSDGYYVFEVTKSRDAQGDASSPTSRTRSSAIIAQQRAQEALAKFGDDYQERWRKETECRSGYVSPDCNNAKPKPNSTVPPGAIPQQSTPPQPAGRAARRRGRPAAGAPQQAPAADSP